MAASYNPISETGRGSPVIFQEVVHSNETGEAGCDEQLGPSERSNGLSQECPTDGSQSRAVGQKFVVSREHVEAGRGHASA